MQIDLTRGGITRPMLCFAAPMIAGNLLQQCYNIADTLIVGRALGPSALASVGFSFTLMTFLTSVLLGLCMGSGALWSMLHGARREEELKRCLFLSFLFIGAVAVVLNVGVLLLLEPVMTLLRIPAEAWDDTHAYLRVVLLGVCFTFLYNYFACLLRSVGNSAAPLVFLTRDLVVQSDWICGSCWGWAGGWREPPGPPCWLRGYPPPVLLSTAGGGWRSSAWGGSTAPSGGESWAHHPLLPAHLRAAVGDELRHSDGPGAGQLLRGQRDGRLCRRRQDRRLRLSARPGLRQRLLHLSGSKHRGVPAGAYSPWHPLRVWVSILFCVVSSLLVCLFAAPLMALFVEPGETEIIAIGVEYLRIEGLCYCGIGILFLLYGLFRGLGRPGVSVVLTVISLGTRVALAYLLAPLPAIGLKGILVGGAHRVGTGRSGGAALLPPPPRLGRQSIKTAGRQAVPLFCLLCVRLLALQVLVVGHLAVDELTVGGEVKHPVTHGLDELMVVGGHQHVHLTASRPLLRRRWTPDPGGWWAGPAAARWPRTASCGRAYSAPSRRRRGP